MKKKLLINQLISAICIIVIILGIIVVATKGFEKSLDYAKVNRIELYLENGYNKEEITQIAKDTFGEKKFQIYDVDKFNQVVAIDLRESYSEEEIEVLKTSVAEKLSIDSEDITIYEINVPTVIIRDIVKPYLQPMIITTVLIVIYIILRNIKSVENIMNKTIKMLSAILLTEGVYFSLIAILGLPINKLTMPIAIVIYLLSIVINIIIDNKDSKK